MTRYAVIRDGLVDNIILLESEEDFPGDPDDLICLSEAHEPVGIGWAIQDGVWVAPEEPLAPEPEPYVEPERLAAVEELVAGGFTEATARLLLGLPPLP